MHFSVVLDVTNADGRQGARVVEVIADNECQAASAGISDSLDLGDRIHDFSVHGCDHDRSGPQPHADGSVGLWCFACGDWVVVEPVLDLTYVPFPEDTRGTTPPHGDGRF